MRVLFKLADLASTEISFLRAYPRRVADGRPAIATPRTLATQLNERTQDFLIVSEDPRRVGRPGSQLRGGADTLPDARRALTLLAVLHAEYWEDFAATLGFLKPSDHPKRAIVPVVLRDSWPKAISWMRQRPIKGVEVLAAVGQELLHTGVQYQTEGQQPPLTVIHGDAHNEQVANDHSILPAALPARLTPSGLLCRRPGISSFPRTRPSRRWLWTSSSLRSASRKLLRRTLSDRRTVDIRVSVSRRGRWDR